MAFIHQHHQGLIYWAIYSIFKQDKNDRRVRVCTFGTRENMYRDERDNYAKLASILRTRATDASYLRSLLVHFVI